jgi:hypothetical protein
MDKSTVYDQFKGYNCYPIGMGEEMIRSRMVELFDRIIRKNETCLVRARDKGMEKLMSRILAVKTRMERMRKEMTHVDPNVEYKFEPMSPADESALKEIDGKMEIIIQQTIDAIEPLTCMETDMHISERFAMMDSSLREIENLCHKRMAIFKKLRVYG